eukprot:scaffold92809_cov33-Phaeocystis_antarctica.AAC.1
MDICPDGMGRRPVGDECCSCLAAGSKGGAAASPPPVVLVMAASGSVDDYADGTLLSVQSKVAALAGVNASAVTITVAAASVLITATIAVPASTTAAA